MFAALLAAAIDLSAPPTPDELVELLWESAADLQPARAQVARARAELDRARLLPNPQLELAAGALPLGAQNPTAPVSQPWLEVPNVGVGLSQLVELGKRGPRQASAQAALEAALHEARGQLAQRYYEVRARFGEIAAAQARIGELAALAADAAHLAELQRARADKGDASRLDADRARLDAQKLDTTRGAEEEHLLAELQACAALASMRCAGFRNAEGAARFLFDTTPAQPLNLGERPDVRALVALEASQRAAELLARRRVVPDLTLRLGYVRDQYLASGSWQNSLYAGLSLPLPVFDRGQAEAQAAGVAAEAARRARERTLAGAGAQLEQLQAQRVSIDARRAHVREQALPLARDVLGRLDAALLRGAVAVQDVLLARRTLVELQLDANDLDLAAFRVRLDIARLGGALPTLPAELER